MRKIAQRLEEAGFATYAVGGAVRDAVLGLPAQDWDLATRAHPDEVRRLFRRTVPLGVEHGTVGVPGRDGVLYEVTTFRRDVETFGRHAVVEFADSIEDDLARRDFTINALAWDPATEELRDPFGGLQDLAAGTLRTVGLPAERFAEDYLRVLRALRFAAHFRLTIEPLTWEALVEATPALPALSGERVREELLKVLSKTRRASAALSLYAASGVLRVLYPELERLVAMSAEAQPESAAREDRVDAAARSSGDARENAAARDRAAARDSGDARENAAAPPADVWAETLRALDALPTSRPLLRTAALLHAVGMPAARTRDLRGGWRYTGHEQTGARLAAEVLRRLRFSNADVERLTRLVRHQSDLFPPDARGAIVRRWLRDVGPDLVHDLWRLRIALWRARHPGAPPAADLLERWRMLRLVRAAHPPLSVSELRIGGADLKTLGLRPGPAMGRTLRALLERVLDQPELNTPEQLLDLAREELGPDPESASESGRGPGEAVP